MDALDHLAGTATLLLERVDSALATSGAPGGHPIWPLMRRLGALPGAATSTIAGLRPAPLAAAGPSLRGLIQVYEERGETIADSGSWEGASAEVFGAHRAALSAHLGQMAGKLGATDGYSAAVAEWIEESRAGLARELAAVLGSREAVTVTVEPYGVPGAVAAAEIGARVLGAVDTAYERAEALLHRWEVDLLELPYQPPDTGPAAFGSTTRA
ncbi:hypothetical protein GCM10022251_67090 [Phytohabitans flavus]|uniref:ESX-1 secretion-associated protein EspA/EspE-like domain-containing protein n=1 Tax=Phytohabitans flavus TaxID=1076124 RepID=A0A6F8Y4X4_9ACTN|nr:hypothetical protein [Phytohabitans flavus]BCB81110.1 hypothetical protein Pflav_075200 [Phytohabitans flavus]